MEQARIAYAQSGIGLSNAEQLLEQARLAFEDLERDYRSTLRLFEIGEVPRRTLEQLEMGVEQAQIRVNQAELGLAQAELIREQARVAVDQAEAGHTQAESSLNLVTYEVPVEALQRANDGLNQAIAARDALFAQLHIAQTALNDTAIRSPISGVISSRGVETGMMIGTSTVTFVVVDMDTVHANINVSENLIGRLSLNQEVEVSIPALGEEPFIGRVDIISPVATAGGAFEVRVSISNEDRHIRVGMYTEVTLVSNRQEQVLVLPRGAVLEDSNARFVYVIENDHARRRVVTTGIEAGNEIAILSGLDDEDDVVIRGQRSLNDGARVIRAVLPPAATDG
jgi:RND family efflux transporter MFP subunit